MNKVESLILLIGKNPLPNLISAVTSVKENGEILLIYTEETKEISGKVDTLLRRKFSEKNININIEKKYIGRVISENNQDNTESILRELNTILKEKIKTKNNIEINYTGATKIISSHAYHIAKSIQRESQDKRIFCSYVDGEKEKIVIEDLGKDEIHIIPFERGIVDFSVRDILEGHGFTNLEDREDENRDLIEFSKKILNFYKNNDNEKIDRFISVLENLNLISKKINKKKNKSEYKEVSYLKKKEELEKIYSEIYEILGEDLKVLEGDVNSQLTEVMVKTEVIIGTWIEYVGYDILKNLKKEGLIDDFEHSVEKENEFEIDLCAYKPYKLFAISVTAENSEDGAVGKLYEIVSRATQVGGRDAGICYITLFDDENKLRYSVKEIWEEESRNLCIITKSNIGKMEEKIRKWIVGGESND